MGHVPHDPPQPSLPQVRPVHIRAHAVQVPEAEQLSPAAQRPHDPPQPSLPQVRSVHMGMHEVHSLVVKAQRAHDPLEGPELLPAWHAFVVRQ